MLPLDHCDLQIVWPILGLRTAKDKTGQGTHSKVENRFGIQTLENCLVIARKLVKYSDLKMFLAYTANILNHPHNSAYSIWLSNIYNNAK